MRWTLFLFALMASSAHAEHYDAARPLSDPTKWLSIDDLPKGAVRRAKLALIDVFLTVGADGNPIECTADFFARNWNDALYERICKIVGSRARFAPVTASTAPSLIHIYDARYWYSIDTTTGREQFRFEPGDLSGAVDQPPRPAPTASVRATPRYPKRYAKPKNRPGDWLTDADYPPDAKAAGAQGVAGFRLTIGIDGRISSCEITRSSGSPSLDQTTCTKLIARAEFESQLDADGQPEPGTYSSSVRWQLPAK
jgi:TonB family protein